MDNNKTTGEQFDLAALTALDTSNKDYQVPEESEYKDSKLKTIVHIIIGLTIGIWIALLLNKFVWAPVIVSGESMLPTFQDGDHLMLSRISRVDYGDIIVCESSESERVVIKRVIGKEGDIITIDYNNDTVTRNGNVIKEDYINEKDMYQMENFDSPNYIEDGVFEYVIPEGEYFVMGDNRNASLDSRREEMGYIEKDNVIGTIFFDLSKFTIVHS